MYFVIFLFLLTSYLIGFSRCKYLHNESLRRLNNSEGIYEQWGVKYVRFFCDGGYDIALGHENNFHTEEINETHIKVWSFVWFITSPAWSYIYFLCFLLHTIYTYIKENKIIEKITDSIFKDKTKKDTESIIDKLNNLNEEHMYFVIDKGGVFYFKRYNIKTDSIDILETGKSKDEVIQKYYAKLGI